MIHPHTELRPISPTIGLGLIATQRIPRGTITWVRDTLDIELTPQEFQNLPPAQKKIVDHYSFLDSRGLYVLCWDGGRYMNHSCEPTTICFGTICDVALRDIEPGDELTCDYALLNIDSDLECHCGARRCRGVIHGSDLEALTTELDAIIDGVAPLLGTVAQPLRELMLADDRARLDLVLRGGAPPSSLENRPGSARKSA